MPSAASSRCSPTSYKGQYVLVEVDATDVLGNVSRTSAWMVL